MLSSIHLPASSTTRLAHTGQVKTGCVDTVWLKSSVMLRTLTFAPRERASHYSHGLPSFRLRRSPPTFSLSATGTLVRQTLVPKYTVNYGFTALRWLYARAQPGSLALRIGG
eukprot:scaffold75823_cov60-Phaeocystis_antarctica.AAC.2